MLGGSRLLPVKQSLGYSSPCDGPGRGGTCDIVTCDSEENTFSPTNSPTSKYALSGSWEELDVA